MKTENSPDQNKEYINPQEVLDQFWKIMELINKYPPKVHAPRPPRQHWTTPDDPSILEFQNG